MGNDGSQGEEVAASKAAEPGSAAGSRADFIGGAALFVFVLLSFGMNWDIVIFYDLTTVMFVAGGALGSILMAFGWRGVQALRRCLFSKPCENDAQSRALATAVCQLGACASFWFGWIGVVIGLIMMLAAEVEVDTLWRGMAVNLIALLYGPLLALLFRIAEYRVRVLSGEHSGRVH